MGSDLPREAVVGVVGRGEPFRLASILPNNQLQSHNKVIASYANGPQGFKSSNPQESCRRPRSTLKICGRIFRSITAASNGSTKKIAGLFFVRGRMG